MKKHKKGKIILFSVLGTLLFVIVLGLILLEVVPRCHKLEALGDTSESSSWMSRIDDDTLLSDITLPGIHDAGARNLKLAAFGKCQDYEISDLLLMGFRYVDLRIGIEEDGSLYIYHGFLKCMTGNTPFSSVLTLDSVMNDCADFIKENPTETLVVSVKYEHGSVSLGEFEIALHNYFETSSFKDYMFYTNTIPALGNVRGRMVLARRNADEAGLGTEAGLPFIWHDQSDKDSSEVPYEMGINAYVQDCYKFKTSDKWNAFVKTMEDTESLLYYGAVFNFLSTNGTPKYGLPYVYAKELNSKFLEKYSNEKIKGWIIVDFGTKELAKTIYEANFR